MKKLEDFIKLTVKDIEKVKGGAEGGGGPTTWRTGDCTNVYQNGQVVDYDYCDDRD